MFDLITKEEFWGWLDNGIKVSNQCSLKDIQDAFILSLLKNEQNKKILEVGGGDSRVLKQINTRNECWNAEKFEGVGNGPTLPVDIPNVRVANTYLGEFSETVPSKYFDFVFSISVIEHISNEKLDSFFQDCARILKPGGEMIHAIDIYLLSEEFKDNKHNEYNTLRLAKLLSYGFKPDFKLNFSESPKIGNKLFFSYKYATHSDMIMYGWNSVAPSLRNLRCNAQSASLKMVLTKN